jgi:(1->4)-alpha-D-glucan 1-alpha-D-glucosylmutase
MQIRYPKATYRVQLNRDFRIEQARALLPFLEWLGISDLYVSPLFRARSGSMHGYDVTDPGSVNPEIGGEEQLNALCEDLHARNMGLLVDIVPNHMAASSENRWWMDVLENGSSSAYASFFDVDWSQAQNVPDLPQIFLPMLGDPFGSVIENRQLRLGIDEEGFNVRYYSTQLPADPSSYAMILEGAPEVFADLLSETARLPERGTPVWEGVEARRRDVPLIQENLWRLYSENSEARQWIDTRIASCNDNVDWMEQFLHRQAYRLAWWQAARERINYRRFFDVSELIGLRQENPEVFAATHKLICEWLSRGCATGLRVDHVDGLFNPREYLERLASECGAHAYIVVEKILLQHETLPEDWKVAGTTGYDFLGIVNNLFVDGANLPSLSNTYKRITGLSWTLDDAAYQQKRWIVQHMFRGEMFALSLHLNLLAELDRHACDLSPEELRTGLAELTACLPVYRTFIENETVSSRDWDVVEVSLAEARRRNASISAPVFEFLRRVFLLQFPPTLTGEQRADWLRFVMRWQQLSGPVTAKGVEDTALYLYNRLISMNEVGGQPEAVSIQEFHAFNLLRRERWPHTMNETSTHDTKRSEDVRARLNILSELPSRWGRLVMRWSRWNRDKKREANAPDGNEEILLYQTMLGAWPLDDAGIPSFITRLKQYVVKAAREAKVYSSWMKPNEDHERAIHEFIDAITNDARFMDSFMPLQRDIAWYGALNSLSQTLLKIASPGAPAFYQGTALWDFSLVDPDNRRPVDVARRLALLNESDGWKADDLMSNWRDGKVKAFVIQRALANRIDGDYIPLDTGDEHLVAFARRDGDRWNLVVVPRFVSALAGAGRLPVGRRVWKRRELSLPAGAPSEWHDAFTGNMVHAPLIAEILHSFPVALLYH